MTWKITTDISMKKLYKYIYIYICVSEKIVFILSRSDHSSHSSSISVFESANKSTTVPLNWKNKFRSFLSVNLQNISTVRKRSSSIHQRSNNDNNTDRKPNKKSSSSSNKVTRKRMRIRTNKINTAVITTTQTRTE